MRALLLSVALLVAGGAVLGCSSGPACAIDTDCPLGNRCAADGQCHVIGERLDSGPSTSDGGPRDAPAGDVRAGDAPSGDARATDTGVAADAPADEDAGT